MCAGRGLLAISQPELAEGISKSDKQIILASCILADFWNLLSSSELVFRTARPIYHYFVHLQRALGYRMG